jgi:hypothetical protein
MLEIKMKKKYVFTTKQIVVIYQAKKINKTSKQSLL